MAISIDSERSFDIIWHSFIFETLRKLEMTVKLLNIRKEINEATKGNSIDNDKEWMISFPNTSFKASFFCLYHSHLTSGKIFSQCNNARKK